MVSHTCSLLLSTNHYMLDSFCPIPESSVLPSVFVNEAPRALMAKTKSNQSQGWESTLLKVMHSCLMSRLMMARPMLEA